MRSRQSFLLAGIREALIPLGFSRGYTFLSRPSMTAPAPAAPGNNSTIIIGAGPAGLTAAYELARAGRSAVVLEQDPSYVGGIARTVCYKGFRFDIGGHRFFSKNSDIEELWTTILGDQMVERQRLSRIFYRGRFFKYPLESFDVLRQLGLYEAAACITSYFAARLRPRRPLVSFEDWVTNAFGRRLFNIFFRSYTEKSGASPAISSAPIGLPSVSKTFRCVLCWDALSVSVHPAMDQ